MAAHARTQIGDADGEKLKLVAEQVEQIDMIDLFADMCRVQDGGTPVAGVGQLANPYKIQWENLLGLKVEDHLPSYTPQRGTLSLNGFI